MASVFERAKTILKATVNDILDKAEDPQKMIDQSLRDLRESLAEVKQSVTEVMANEKRDLRALNQCKDRVARLQTAAQNALKGGSEEDARKLVAAKQEEESKLPALQANYDNSSANSAKMRQMHNDLVDRINDLEARRDTVKATMANASAQQRINKLMESGSDASDTIGAFERMEEKAQRMLDEAQSRAELNDGNSDESAEDIAQRWSAPGNNASVDDELAAMKKDLGL